MPPSTEESNGGGVILAAPKIQITAETDLEFYRRKQNTVVVRHVSGDRSWRWWRLCRRATNPLQHAIRAFIQKAAEMIDKGVHLLILDLHPPGNRVPGTAIWRSALAGRLRRGMSTMLITMPNHLTFAYERSGDGLRHAVRGGGRINRHAFFSETEGPPRSRPIAATYQAAFRRERWRTVLERSAT